MEVHDVTHLFQIPLVWPREALQVGRITGIAVHHEAVLWMRPDATVEEEINHLRAIDRYHREVKQYGGFAYHLASFPTGRIYQVTSLKQMGAHVYQKNDHLYGIMLAGLFSVTVPGDKQLNATAAGIAHIDNFLGRKVEVKGHREWATAGSSTACPGNTHAQWVPGLRGRIKEDDMMTLAEIETWIDGHNTWHAEQVARRLVDLEITVSGHNTWHDQEVHPKLAVLETKLTEIERGLAQLGAGRFTTEELADQLTGTVKFGVK